MMKRFFAYLIAVVVISTPFHAFGEGILLPKGTIIAPPNDAPSIELDVSKYLVDREDIEYYVTLQDKFDALTKAHEACETQLRLITEVPEPEPSFWESELGTVVVIGGISVGISGAFIAGYLLGR